MAHGEGEKLQGANGTLHRAERSGEKRENKNKKRPNDAKPVRGRADDGETM